MEMFNYSTNQNQITPMNYPVPIFSDFNPNSEFSQKMTRAKRINDETYWPTMRQVFAHDFETLPKERFKVWDSVWNVPIITRTRFYDYIECVMDQTKKDSRWKFALEEPMIGLTEADLIHLSMFEDFKTTMNRIQLMAHLILCGFDIDSIQKMESIIEFGAGVGDLADIINKLGFKGKYIIYDFPELMNIQKYYHDRLGYDNITYVSDFNNLESSDLAIATWSLTEMPIDLRDNILSKIPNTKNWLIAYSNKIFGYDNDQYIKEVLLKKFGENKDIKFLDIPFMPWDGGAHYVTIKEKT
jgi:hypothetical protein